MKIICIIPARGGSKGLIKKNGLREAGDDVVIIKATNVLITEIDKIFYFLNKNLHEIRKFVHIKLQKNIFEIAHYFYDLYFILGACEGR